MPLLSLFLVYGLVPVCRRRPAALLCAALAAFSVGVQVIGVYCDDEDWNRTPLPVEEHPERLWDWSDLHLVRAFRSGWHGGELWPLCVTAFFDPVPARLTSLPADALAGRVTVEAPPARLRPDGFQRVVAVITNQGPQAWPAFAADYYVRDIVFLLVRWLANGEMVSGAGDVVRLPKNVCPGEMVQIPLRLTAPAQRGRYEVELRAVQAVNSGVGASIAVYRFPLTVD
jgi:hypothetical protein